MRISFKKKNNITNFRRIRFRSFFIVPWNVVGAFDNPKGITTNS